MKRRPIATLSAIMAAAITLSSCVGSFSLFNGLARWNKSATKYKLLNELIFIVISPAYAVCGIADLFVLNTIEFWSGTNPMASNIGKTKKVKGDDGQMYTVKYLADGYEVTRPDGQKYYFVYDKKADTWSMVENGKRKELFKFNHNGTVRMTLPTGKQTDVALNEGGLFQLRTEMAGNTYYMAAR